MARQGHIAICADPRCRGCASTMDEARANVAAGLPKTVAARWDAMTFEQRREVLLRDRSMRDYARLVDAMARTTFAQLSALQVKAVRVLMEMR